MSETTTPDDSQQSVEIADAESSDLDELNDDGLGATVTEHDLNTFEPEEDETKN